MREGIRKFLAAREAAVVGVSIDPDKYGARVYRHLKGRGFRVYAVNPLHDELYGDPCWPNLSALPVRPRAVIFITPPQETLRVMREALGLGIRLFWMQPGSEEDEAVRLAREAGAECVVGHCVMVTREY